MYVVMGYDTEKKKDTRDFVNEKYLLKHYPRELYAYLADQKARKELELSRL